MEKAWPEPPKNPVAIKNMFTRLAKGYDLANRVMSFGRDPFWRKALAQRLKVLEQPGHLLDLATGTGDQVVAFKKAHPPLKVTGLDLSAAMMDLAKAKFSVLAAPAPELVEGNALDLPFNDNSFDSVSMSFGLRNVGSRPRLYSEVLRVLKPGGRFLILEMYHERNSIWAGFLSFYLRKVIPWIGGRILSKEPEAYKYLAASIMNFPDPIRLMEEMATAGFIGLASKTYTLKTVMLVFGEKAYESSRTVKTAENAGEQKAPLLTA